MAECIRLHTGLFRCARCTTEYDYVRMRTEDLVCYDCGEELTWINPIQVWVRRYPSSLIVRNTPCRQGLERAKAKGVRLGRPIARVPENRLQALHHQRLPIGEIARQLGVSRATVRRRLRTLS